MLLAIAGLKGGVGKTTAAISIAVECLTRGHRVLLVDLDPIGALRLWSEHAVEHGNPSPPTLALGRHMPEPGQLRELGRGYDLVVVDCPPADPLALHTALLAADVAVLPCTPRPMDVWTLGPTLDVVEHVREDRTSLATTVLINRRDDRTNAAAQIRTTLQEHGLDLLDAMLGARVAYSHAMATGQSVTGYDPDGLAADEVRALVDELGHTSLAPSLAPSAVH